ncbi:hypothetical protein Ahy_A05g025538 [Arachis hypogaea]|uniref:RSE1/DDB1/CPSF1 C-terminal domain-containing protein n=1 Tax=Arachis hypogaea TaxID=3818 RepID=A0A445D8Z3_ARAHY|nr:hypothetical protein Ahy_A05g025538 [Arachis hypogaea]
MVPCSILVASNGEVFLRISPFGEPDTALEEGRAISDGIKLDENEVWQFRFAYGNIWQGMVLAICPYLDRYFLASVDNTFYVCDFSNDNPQRVRKFVQGRTRFLVTVHFTRIAVGDCRDGVIFYFYHKDTKRLEQLYSDPLLRLVADCILMDAEMAVGCRFGP